MDIKKEYERWLANATADADVVAELKTLDDAKIEDAFYRDLAFGTGGLRGVIGAGTNRMNIYTVAKASQGLADYLKKNFETPSVAIGYDSRIKSDVFAKVAAGVFAANGVKVNIWPVLMPVPTVSFATRYLHTSAGVMVTASHNPSKYNGYKVYGADGCQITLEAAEKILAAIEKIDCFDDVRLADFDAAAAAGRIVTIDEKCLDDFVQAVYDQRVGDGAGIDALKLVYTPLNGTGLECVKKLLKKLGVTHVTVVPEQEMPDGDFPTCPYPNPEIREAMQKGLELCDKVRPDLLLGTDPDCDRCGTAVPDGKGGYRLITGNEMGIILLDYICRTRLAQGTMPADPVAVTTIVSTDMAAPDGIVEVLKTLLMNMVANPVSSLLNANYIGVLTWGVIIGVGMRAANDTTKKVLDDISNGLSQVVSWIISMAPFGILGLVFSSISSNGLEIFSEYGKLLLVLVGSMLFIYFVTNPIIVFWCIRKNPYPLIFKCLKKSAITAFFTRSSAANIPVNMKACEEWGMDKDTYSVTIPLGATINMDGAAITITVMTLAAANTLGIHVDFLSGIVLSILATLAACGASGVAGGSLLLIPMACSLFGISNDIAMQIVGVGFIIGVIQDSVETALNSSSDLLLSASAEFRQWRLEGKEIKY